MLALLVGAAGCGLATDEAGGEERVSRVEQAYSTSDVLNFVWDHKPSPMEAIKGFYTAVNWFNCNLAGSCPESDAHLQASRVINDLETAMAGYYTDARISDFNTLLDEAAADFAKPDLLLTDVGTIEEQHLVDFARDLFIHFRDQLNLTDPTNAAQVNAAYVLAPYFNLLAALVDNIGQIAMQNPRIFI